MKIKLITRGQYKTAVGVILVLALLASPNALRLWADDVPKSVSSEKLLVRTYVVSPTFFDKDPELAAANNNRAFDVRRLLIPRGIRFTPGTSATYTPSVRKLVLVNYPDQIELFEELADTDR